MILYVLKTNEDIVSGQQFGPMVLMVQCLHWRYSMVLMQEVFIGSVVLMQEVFIGYMVLTYNIFLSVSPRLFVCLRL